MTTHLSEAAGFGNFQSSASDVQDMLTYEFKLTNKISSKGIRALEFAKMYAKETITKMTPGDSTELKVMIDEMYSRDPKKALTYNPVLLALGLLLSKVNPRDYNTWRASVNSRMGELRFDDKDLTRYGLMWREGIPLSYY